jgi:hypothetical protein
MINPTFDDIGRMVVYKSRFARKRADGQFEPAGEEGVITSFNPYFVFVRYGMGSTSAATRREDLNWSHGHDSEQLASPSSGSIHD